MSTKLFEYKYERNAVTFSSQELQVPDFLFFGQCLLPTETKLDFVLSS